MQMTLVKDLVKPYFVYGTLRPGMGLHLTWQGAGAEAHLDGVAFVRGFVMTHTDIPFVHHTGNPEHIVLGAVIVPDPDDLATAYKLQECLDRIEGAYDRTPVTVEGGDEPIDAWIYVAKRNWQGVGHLVPTPADYKALRTW